MKDYVREFVIIRHRDDHIYSYEYSTLRAAMLLVDDLRDTYPDSGYRLYKLVTAEDY